MGKEKSAYLNNKDILKNKHQLFRIWCKSGSQDKHTFCLQLEFLNLLSWTSPLYLTQMLGDNLGVPDSFLWSLWDYLVLQY